MALITAKVRESRGTRAARRMRADGKVPAVLYGHKQKTIALTLDAEELETLIRHGAKGLLEVDVEGTKESAIIKDLQWDVFGREILHIDLSRVSMDERLTVHAAASRAAMVATVAMTRSRCRPSARSTATRRARMRGSIPIVAALMVTPPWVSRRGPDCRRIR